MTPGDEGTPFGRYLLQRELGHGGMGEVYVAFDTHKACEVAVKRLRREYAEDRDFQARFRREAQLAARLRDPHVIPVHDYGEIDGQLYIEMRLVDGVDLEKALHAGAIEQRDALDVLAQTASALDSAHAAGLVHRDVKPSNIVLSGGPTRSGYFAYLVDFGVARPLLGHGGSKLTATIGTVGTLGYIAPERIDGQTGDGRADVYSLTCVLFECLTRRCPYVGEPVSVMYAHTHKPIPRATDLNPDLPLAIDDVIARGMAKNPEERYATASDLIDAAREALGSTSTKQTGNAVAAAPTPPLTSRTTTVGPSMYSPPASTSPEPETETATRIRPIASGLVGLGLISLILAFTTFSWYRQGGGSIFDNFLRDSTFSHIHRTVDVYSAANESGPYVSLGVTKVYYDWLAWTLFAVCAAAGLLATLPLRHGSSVARLVGSAIGVVGFGLTLWAVRLFGYHNTDLQDYFGAPSPSYGSWLAQMNIGAYGALLGFVLVTIGSILGLRGARPPAQSG